jgi:hypothetical protein
MDPVTLYKDGSERLIASVDVPGWLADGWGTEKPESEATAEEAAIDSEASADVEVKSSVKRK